jgi:hypothetical protein
MNALFKIFKDSNQFSPDLNRTLVVLSVHCLYTVCTLTVLFWYSQYTVIVETVYSKYGVGMKRLLLILQIDSCVSQNC